MMPAIAIARVSSGKQSEESQVPDLERFAAENGYELLHTEQVHGKSAFHGKHLRQVHAAIDTHVAHGAAVAVIFWKLDRSTRQGLEGAVELRKHIREAGARMLFATQPYLNSGDQAAEMMFANLAIMAQEESKTKSDRILSHFDARYALGSITGTCPWGYEITDTDGNPAPEKYAGIKVLSLKPGYRQWVEEIFRQVANGMSLEDVALWLEQQGAPQSARGVHGDSEGGWWARTVASIVRSTTYMGLHRSGFDHTACKATHRAGEKCTRGIQRTVKCEAAVTSYEFRAANDNLDKRPKRGTVVADNRAMLSAAAHCPNCDSPVYRIKTGGEVKYRCAGTGAHRKGCGNNTPLDKVDALANEMLTALDTPVTTVTRVPDDTDEKIAALENEMRLLGSKDRRRWLTLADQIEALESARPGSPYRVETATVTYGELFAACSTDAERNDFIKEYGIRFYVAADISEYTNWKTQEHRDAKPRTRYVPAFIAGLGARVIARKGDKGYTVAERDGVTVIAVYGTLTA